MLTTYGIGLAVYGGLIALVLMCLAVGAHAIWQECRSNNTQWNK